MAESISVDTTIRKTANRVIGIDFSMSSPAICVASARTPFQFKDCQFYFLTGNKKLVGDISSNIHGLPFKDYAFELERFLNNACSIRDVIEPCQTDLIAIEGYAFGAKGSRIFQIAEATGIAKLLLSYDSTGKVNNNGQNLISIAPSAAKKFATGKGNADKQAMYDAFKGQTGIDMLSVFNMTKLQNPVHDVIDAYFIASCAHSELQKS